LQGTAALENNYADAVIESLMLFGELLDFKTPPQAMTIRHHWIAGAVASTGKIGPLVIFSKIDNSLKAITTQLNPLDKAQVEFLNQVAAGREAPTLEGADVFMYLKDQIAQQQL